DNEKSYSLTDSKSKNNTESESFSSASSNQFNSKDDEDDDNHSELHTCYPSNNHNQNQQDNGEPLLPNIRPHQLTRTELSRRSLGSIKSALQIVQNNTTIPSFLREKYHLYYDDLLERLKGDFAILDFNYTRLNKYMRMLAYEQMRVFNLRPHEILRIDEKEYPIALEFYLQFDGMFFLILF
ncbi:unnamed protein product, partial [Rotaria sp. Silwood1]